MFRLRRFYLDSCGVTENRFSDLLIDLTDVDGNPTDAIVWLRNGAGKTTMLSLLLALILPDRRHFLATRTKKRTLEDLILAGDTAHVVAEWADPDGRRLLTGAVYEWDRRSRPSDYNGKGKEQLKRSWWLLRPDPSIEGSALDDLPFTRRSDGHFDRERFCAHISGLAARGADAVVASQSITEWHNALRDRRFDPDLFLYFTEVNSAEGGIEELFAGIDSPGKFVRWLLKFVGNQQQVTPVRDLLSDTAAEIAKRPMYIHERTFCQEAESRVLDLGRAHQEHAEALNSRADVHTRAADYLRGLLDAAIAAEYRRDTADLRVKDLEAAVSSIRTDTDMSRSRRAEYLSIAAAFELKEVQAESDAADAAVTAAVLDTKAWAAVEHLVAVRIREAELEGHRSALGAASDTARPLVEEVESVKAVLAGALDNEIIKAVDRIAELRDQITRSEAEEVAADGQRHDAQKQIAQLESERTEMHSLIARFDADSRRLVTEGIIDDTESLSAGMDRLAAQLATAEADIAQLRDHLLRLTEDISTARGQLENASAAVGKAAADHQPLAAELKRLLQRAASLADNARLRTLLQTDSVDLERESADAVTTLEKAQAATDNELVGLKQAIAQSERALHALQTTGLLPPRLDVEKVIDELRAAGVTAYSGWRYLAENVDARQHTQQIAELPAAVDGVIVYSDDPASLAGHLTNPVDELVVLSPATAFTETHPQQVVVGPNPAQHDKTAAASELDARRSRHAADIQTAAAVAAQRSSDAQLAAQIQAFVNELPPDGIEGLRSREAQAAATLAEAQRHHGQVQAKLDALRATADDVQRQLADARENAARLAAALPRVRALVDTEHDAIGPARIRLDAIPHDLDRATARAQQASERTKAASETTAQLTVERQLLTRTRSDWETARASLPKMAEATTQSLEAAQAAVRIAEDNLRQNFPEHALRQAVERAEAEVQRAVRPWSLTDQAVRDRATMLAATPAAADAASRADAAGMADQRRTRSERTQGLVEAKLRAAEEKSRKAAEEFQLRTRAGAEIVRPTDRNRAEELAAAADAEVSRGEVERHRREQERDTAKADADRAAARTDMLTDQAGHLRRVLPADTTTVVIPDDVAVIRSTVKSHVDDLNAAEDLVLQAQTDLRDCADELSRWASRDDFAKVADDEHGQFVHQLRELFRDRDAATRTADTAEDLARELNVRERAITQQLAQVEEHKRNIGVRMTDLVGDAINVLGRASSLSELPAGIGPWAHQRFVIVEPRSRPTPDQIGLRISELIDTMVNGGSIESDSAELLWLATNASVPEGFRATVLKPAPDQPTGRTPVDEMRKWSGGENLTASLVLFCVFARLRAEQRTGSRSGTAGGVLPLDNPLGKANYLPFLELQRRVARANGVQLVFWTGIGDLGAVTTFPRIVAMHKRPSTTRPGRAYVQIDADIRTNNTDGTHVLDAVSTVRHEP
jgi:hypothetical protein